MLLRQRASAPGDEPLSPPTEKASAPLRRQAKAHLRGRRSPKPRSISASSSSSSSSSSFCRRSVRTDSPGWRRPALGRAFHAPPRRATSVLRPCRPWNWAGITVEEGSFAAGSAHPSSRVSSGPARSPGHGARRDRTLRSDLHGLRSASRLRADSATVLRTRRMTAEELLCAKEAMTTSKDVVVAIH